MNPRNLFIELKRRNVYKVAIAYAVVAWLLMQIATQIFPFLEIPDWAIRLVIMLLALGFPIALILAWAYELTPEGIKRTDQIEPGQRSRNRAWIYVVIIAGAMSIGLFFVGRYSAPRNVSESANIPVKSIAVLPFDNQNRDPDTEYLSDGSWDRHDFGRSGRRRAWWGLRRDDAPRRSDYEHRDKLLAQHTRLTTPDHISGQERHPIHVLEKLD